MDAIFSVGYKTNRMPYMLYALNFIERF